MTKSKLVLTASVGALIFGVAGYAAAASEQHDALAKNRIVIAADDSAAGDDEGESDGSAKMGDEEGTHVGEEQGSAPENDTQKIDQPARRNPTTSNAPAEDDEYAVPSEDDEEAPPE